MSHDVYNDQFFARLAINSLNSARIIAPIIIRLLNPRSVVDVGCGVGSWLKAFIENGVESVCGFDGGYVDRTRLLIEPEYFTAADLTRPFKIEGSFDLALCLEVAEHLPAKRAPSLVATLAGAAPAVLFSAAVPGQKGQGHINERWPSYWRRLFRRHGFWMLDPIRPLIRNDRRVMWWYRQNMLLLVRSEMLRENAGLAKCASEKTVDMPFLHAEMIRRKGSKGPHIDEWITPRELGISWALRARARSLYDAIVH